MLDHWDFLRLYLLFELSVRRWLNHKNLFTFQGVNSGSILPMFSCQVKDQETKEQGSMGRSKTCSSMTEALEFYGFQGCLRSDEDRYDLR